MFDKNLKYLREKFGMEQMDLAERLGRKSSSSVSEWEKGKYTPKIKTLAEIANIFKVDLDDLMNEDLSIIEKTIVDKITEVSSQLEPPRQEKVYNFADRELKDQNTTTVYGQTAAGEAIEYNDQFEIQEEQVSYIPKGTDGALVVRGKSMSPLLENGELLFFEKTPQVENGEIAVVEIKGEAVTTKKVRYDFENEIIILESVNPDFDDMKFKSEDVKIIGRVLL